MDFLKLTPDGHLPAGTDVERIAQYGDERELMALRDTYFHRRLDADMLAKATPDRRGLWEASLAETAEVTPLQALAAGHRLARLLTGGRWYLMQDAREAGASWTEVGAALEMSKQGAADWYARKIDDQERALPDFHDAARARAVLGETGPPAPATATSSPAAAERSLRTEFLEQLAAAADRLQDFMARTDKRWLGAKRQRRDLAALARELRDADGQPIFTHEEIGAAARMPLDEVQMA
jgi:hypothetical protein